MKENKETDLEVKVSDTNFQKPVDGILIKSSESLIYSYVTEFQIDVSEIEGFSL